MSTEKKIYDTLVIGGGIAGQEAALNLADMDHNVLLVEKEMSIGGKMIALSKVFPTLDCAACITTPKMSETARHPNISLLLNSTVQEITKTSEGFSIQVLKKPRYVKAEACTGCQECEAACPEIRDDKYNLSLVGSKVVNIPFALANPRIACIDRNDTSAPCISACPGGVKPYGYISLVRNGQYEDAMLLHLEDAPIPGSLGRACYAPCQGDCTRGMLEAPVDIRRIKRFFADDYYARYPKAPEKVIEIKTGKRIAVVGSGPAGLTAAYFLAQKGHTVTIFEAAPEAGGMLKLTIPEYRLPKNIVDRDIQNITSLGVEIKVNTRIESIAELKNSGFDSVFISVGTHDTRRLNAEGSDLRGIVSCLDFLREANIGKKENLAGKKVMVIGGGNTAIDAARTAIRMGAAKVSIVYRRSREEMPSFIWEIKEAEEEGVELLLLRNPVRFIGENGKVTEVELIKMQLGAPDASGRRSPEEMKGSEYTEAVDYVIEAIGLQPSTSPFKNELELNKNGTIRVNDKTLQTSQPDIFAGGDSVTGPTTIIEAVGQGKKAAFYIDKYLKGENPEAFEFGDKLPAADKQKVLSRDIAHQLPVSDTLRPVSERIKDYDEIERTFTEEEVRLSGSRCLDCSNCRECHQCVSACPANAIDFSQKEEIVDVEVKSVVISTGFNLFKPENKPHYGYKQLANVVDSLQMDRLIAPTRPFNNILRPGDGKVPGNIAYVLCTGSRDSSLENNRTCSTDCSNNPICSQICCMYSIKQAQLLMGALPLADITIYYIDIRAFGKGYEEFYQQTRSMGVNFVKGKVARIQAKNGDPNGDVVLRYEDIATGRVKEMAHDMVVLSVGVLPNKEIPSIFKNEKLELDPYNYVRQVDELINPARTTIDGVFVAGTASGPMDIPDSILSAGTAASEVAGYLAGLG
jgi:heterodisulfide reductase subunit A-like polyferredoxin